MKTLLTLLLATLLWSSNAFAASGCELLHTMAETVMSARQAGVPITKIIQAMDDAGVDGKVADATQQLIVLAYQQPRFSTEQYQQEAITDFANKFATACYSRQ